MALLEDNDEPEPEQPKEPEIVLSPEERRKMCQGTHRGTDSRNASD